MTLKTNDKKYLMTVLLSLFLFFVSQLCYSQNQLKKQDDGQVFADNVASAIAKAMFEVDSDAMKNIISIISANNYLVKAIKADDVIVNETLITAYRENEELVFNNQIPNDILAINSYQSPVIIDGEHIGLITIYYGSNRINLTTEEKEWLHSHPDIRLGVDPNFPPFEFIDSRGGYAGISSEFLKLINEQLDINMQVVKGLTWSEVIEQAKQKNIDILPVAGKTPERSQYLNFTKPYLNFPTVFLTRKDKEPVNAIDDLTGKRVALVEDYYYVDEVLSKNLQIEAIYVDSPFSALKAVLDNKADIAIADSAVVSHLMLKHEINAIRIDTETGLSDKGYSYAIRKDWPELVSILNKVLGSISEAKRKQIQERWVAHLPD